MANNKHDEYHDGKVSYTQFGATAGKNDGYNDSQFSDNDGCFGKMLMFIFVVLALVKVILAVT